MKQPGQRKRSKQRQRATACLNGQRGQAYVEYVLITALVLVSAIGLFWGDPSLPNYPSLVSLFKSFFSAYSFTLSLP